jgi:exopolysaccharide biosynthesis polyprenyl glycosylphosphotransferase
LNNINFDIGSKYYIESSCDIEAALDFAFETLNIDYVIILPRTDQHQVDKIVSSALSMRKLCFIVPNVEEIAVQKSHITYFGDILTFRIDKMGLSFEQRFIKRSLDIAVSLTALILLLPILIIVYLLIFFSDGENPIFTQERLSRDRKHFKLIKFRTMIPDAEMKTGPVLSTKNDDRITKLGRFLRRTRIDELPQLINVLRGEMSIVGPRPEREVFVKDFIKSDKNYAYRYRVKAGITGLAQVKGKYNTSFYDKVRMDLFYIQNYSLLMDIKIMLSTFVVFFKSSKAEGVSSKTETIIQKKSNSESEYVYIID